MMHLYRSWGSDTPLETLIADSAEDMWSKLQETKQVFVKDGIPASLGGLWRKERFEAWLQHQKAKVSDDVIRGRSGASVPVALRRKVRQDMKRRMDTLISKMESKQRGQPSALSVV
jgi:hypothetical protein